MLSRRKITGKYNLLVVKLQHDVEEKDGMRKAST